jgi:hypothetical protein
MPHAKTHGAFLIDFVIRFAQGDVDRGIISFPVAEFVYRGDSVSGVFA